MARALTVTRRAVTSEREAAYLAERGEEAERFEGDGDHLWVFRHESHPGVYLEFRESVDRDRLLVNDPTAEIWHGVDLGVDAMPRSGEDEPT